MKHRKTKQTGINGAKYSGYKGKKIKHKGSKVFAGKVSSHYKKSPPRTKPPSDDNYTHMSREAYIRLCRGL